MKLVHGRTARWRAAFRAVAMLLVVALLTSLVADLRHHSAHAGQTHGLHALAGEHVHASSIVASAHAEPLAMWSASTEPPLANFHHGKSGGCSASCDCCNVSCFALMMPDELAFARPTLVPSRVRIAPDVVAFGLPVSLDRPPIVSL